jgi:transcription termination factor Rho
LSKEEAALPPEVAALDVQPAGARRTFRRPPVILDAPRKPSAAAQPPSRPAPLLTEERVIPESEPQTEPAPATRVAAALPLKASRFPRTPRIEPAKPQRTAPAADLAPPTKIAASEAAPAQAEAAPGRIAAAVPHSTMRSSAPAVTLVSEPAPVIQPRFAPARPESRKAQEARAESSGLTIERLEITIAEPPPAPLALPPRPAPSFEPAWPALDRRYTGRSW